MHIKYIVLFLLVFPVHLQGHENNSSAVLKAPPVRQQAEPSFDEKIKELRAKIKHLKESIKSAAINQKNLDQLNSLVLDLNPYLRDGYFNSQEVYSILAIIGHIDNKFHHIASDSKKFSYRSTIRHIVEIASLYKRRVNKQGWSFKWKDLSSHAVLKFVIKLGDLDHHLRADLVHQFNAFALRRWAAEAKRVFLLDLNDPKFCIHPSEFFNLIKSLGSLRVSVFPDLRQLIEDKWIAIEKDSPSNLSGMLTRSSSWLKSNFGLPPQINFAYAKRIKKIVQNLPENVDFALLINVLYQLIMNDQRNAVRHIPLDIWNRLKVLYEAQSLDEDRNRQLKTIAVWIRDVPDFFHSTETEKETFVKLKNTTQWMIDIPTELVDEDQEPSRTEEIVNEILDDKCSVYGCTIKQEFYNDKLLFPVDFFLENREKNLIVEYNGPSHYFFNIGNLKYRRTKDEYLRQERLKLYYPDQVVFIEFDKTIVYPGNTLSENKVIIEEFLQGELAKVF